MIFSQYSLQILHNGEMLTVFARTEGHALEEFFNKYTDEYIIMEGNSVIQPGGWQDADTLDEVVSRIVPLSDIITGKEYNE